MIKKDLCLSVRDQVGAESMGCIDPYPDEHGNYRVRKWVTYQGIVIHCAFFEKHLGWRFYIADRDLFFITNKEDQVILRWHDGCGIQIYDFIEALWNANKEITMLFIHSCFCRMVRAVRAAIARAADADAAAAVDAARDAAEDAAVAYKAVDAVAYKAARDAARAAYDAYKAARDAARAAGAAARADAAADAARAADAAVAYDAYDAARDAARAAYAAADAAYAAADAAVEATEAARRAFRKMIILRKEVAKLK